MNKPMTVADVRAMLRGQVAAQEQVTLAETEHQLEAETGHEVVKTGSNPPTLVETDKPKAKK